MAHRIIKITTYAGDVSYYPQYRKNIWNKWKYLSHRDNLNVDMLFPFRYTDDCPYSQPDLVTKGHAEYIIDRHKMQLDTFKSFKVKSIEVV